MKPLLAAVLLFAASAPALAQESPYTRIFMERTACYGTCPVYSVELRENGSVTYTGTQYVRVSGTRRWTVDAQAVQSLARDMARAGFFDWKDEYTAPVMDLPTTYVTLTAGGRTKKIKDHLGAPPALKEIEARIDAVSGARGYVAIDAAAVRDMVAKGWRPTGGDAVRWLQIAVSSGDAETVRALLAAGMNARAADDEGVTLVMRAVESGDPETVRAVLAAGGDPTARDRSGRNAADRARDGLAQTSRGLVGDRTPARLCTDPPAVDGRMTIGVSIAAAVTLGVVVSADAASLRGVVRDTQCEVLPGVEVILRGDSTVRQVITGQSGEFAFDDLPEPRYSLEARLQGFQVLSRADVLPSTILKPVLLVLPLGFPAVAQHVEGVTDRGPTGYSVHVLDESCRPVEGAAVSLAAASGAWTGRTDGKGDAPLPDLEHGAYSLRISAPGFSPSSLSADTPPRYRLTITMPLFRGPPEAATLFEPSPSTRVTQPEPMSEPRIRIVAIGDSTTAGTPGYQSPREAPPRGAGDETSQYAYWLMKAHPGWEVINQGVNAQRSDTIAARFDEDVLARKPEVVVILAGVNDVYQGRPAQHVKDQLAAMYQRARAAGIHVVAGTIIPYNTATADQNARMREINTWIRSQADAGLVTFVDTRAAVAAADDPDKLAGSPDGLHPDVAGYRRMADAIAPAIERVLAAR